MRVIMLGMNHRTAPVELREKLSLSADRLDAFLGRIRSLYPRAEAVVLSTCNRTEVYLARGAHDEPTAEQVHAELARLGEVDAAVIAAAMIHRENEDAVAHLCRVCAGLESMVLGEPQVLGQVKRAYEASTARATVGPVLHKVFQQSIAVGKRVRAETGIDTGRASVGSAAADFARQIFSHFDDKTVVGIGAGEMAKLVLVHLKGLGAGKLWVTSRSQAPAALLAERLELDGARGGVRPFADLNTLLVEADIVVTSTASPEPIITKKSFKPILKKRRGRPLFLIDVAVPRNVEPSIGSLTNVYLYNIDDLQQVVARAVESRGSVVAAAEAMTIDAARAILAEIQNRDVGQLIRALRQRLHGLGEVERDRTRRKVAALSDEELRELLPELLEEHTQRLINKILHLPLSQLDRGQTPLGFYAAALRRLFDLTEDGQENPLRQAATDNAGPRADSTPAMPSADEKVPAHPIPVTSLRGRAT